VRYITDATIVSCEKPRNRGINDRKRRRGRAVLERHQLPVVDDGLEVELGRERQRPGADLVPVTQIDLRQVVEGKAELLRVDHAAEDRLRPRLELGEVLERVVELLPRRGEVLRPVLVRTEREDGKGQALERSPMALRKSRASWCQRPM
jgi:hypothetical protein